VDADQKAHLLRVADIAGLAVSEPSWPVERDLIANRIRLHMLEWGQQDAQPLILLHGGNLTAHTWDPICLVLAQRYRCLAVDLRGHGESEWPADADYRLDAMAADIEQLIASEVGQSPLLVGMSLGGLTAIKLGGNGLVALRGLVIVDVGPRPQAEGARKIIEFSTRDYELDDFEEFVQRALQFNPRRKPELLRRSLRTNLRQLPNGRWTWKWDRRRMQEDQLERLFAEQLTLWDAAAQISCPTLIVRGDRSAVFFESDAEELAATIADSRVAVVADAGHTVQGDNPRGLLAAMLPFFTDLGLDLVNFEAQFPAAP
jgi:pimeloyl-ACP methyl ester carboxylesterase